jgi:hypothetical protein
LVRRIEVVDPRLSGEFYLEHVNPEAGNALSLKQVNLEKPWWQTGIGKVAVSKEVESIGDQIFMWLSRRATKAKGRGGVLNR